MPKEDDSEGSQFGSGKNPKVAAPSVVGYAANIGKANEFEFVGDFVYQELMRDGKVEIVRIIVQRCVEQYRKHRQCSPKQIILYRNGVNEGQFEFTLKYEVPLIKATLKSIGCMVPLVVIISNKMQAIRFFNKAIDDRAKPSDQNIKPGTVIDHSVVHPQLIEFFVNSHRALQGTARTPKYTVLVNECKLSLDQLERMTYALCFGHQIVFSPTSLPSPVYIAIRYAERGRKLYQAWVNQPENRNAQISYEDLSSQLSYHGNKELEYRRINA